MGGVIIATYQNKKGYFVVCKWNKENDYSVVVSQHGTELTHETYSQREKAIKSYYKQVAKYEKEAKT